MEGKNIKIVSVDTCTVSCGDIDFSALGKLGDVTFYDVLSAGGLAHAAAEADALLVNKANVEISDMSAHTLRATTMSTSRLARAGA